MREACKPYILSCIIEPVVGRWTRILLRMKPPWSNRLSKRGTFGALLLAALAVFGAACQATPVRATPSSTVASAAAPTATPPTGEWIVIDLPSTATQLQFGAQVYRLVCSTCHGDQGQGLTAAWRATWAPRDQNCWQSKCHGPTHPPDGFVLPVAPAINGGGALSGFSTAQDLHDFIQTTLPWQNPNSLTEKDSWAVTADVLKMNGVDPGTQLGPDTAASVRVGH